MKRMVRNNGDLLEKKRGVSSKLVSKKSIGAGHQQWDSMENAMQRRSTLVAIQDCKSEEQVQGGAGSHREKVKNPKLGHIDVLVLDSNRLTMCKSSCRKIRKTRKTELREALTNGSRKLLYRALDIFKLTHLRRIFGLDSMFGFIIGTWCPKALRCPPGCGFRKQISLAKRLADLHWSCPSKISRQSLIHICELQFPLTSTCLLTPYHHYCLPSLRKYPRSSSPCR